MIGRAYLAEPAHVAIEDDRALPQLLEWTKADVVLEALEFLVD